MTARELRRSGAIAWPGAAVALCLVAVTAAAAPWVPAAGAGDVEAMVRQYEATRSFPSTSFGTATNASSEERDLMYRVT